MIHIRGHCVLRDVAARGVLVKVLLELSTQPRTADQRLIYVAFLHVCNGD
jgi:hypothetical protein